MVYSHHVRVADRWRVGRVFLAGDAAHAMPPWIGQGMSAGVRDVSNLCWKLAAVLRGQAPESLLDSYQAERKPHVTEVTRRAVLVGRVINERRRAVASLRNHVLRALSKVPGLVTRAQRFWWIPDARYRDGFLATGHPAVGWQLPQPWVRDATGATVRFDDAVGGQWALLHIGAPPAGARSWAELGVPQFELSGPGRGHRTGAIVDTSGTLTRWMRAKKARTVVLRPDGFIYAAADFGHQLPAPPAGLAHQAARRPRYPDPNGSHRMTTTQLTEHVVTVSGKPIFVAEAGTGPAVVMLHGGGPGASGVSNYSRNIDALAANFRVIVPDMPGYGRSVKGVDQSDPFGYLADMIRGLLDELGHRHRTPGRQLLRRRRRTAIGARHPTPGRQAGADGTRRDRHDTRRADGGVEEPAVLLRRTGRAARSWPISSAPTWCTTVPRCPTN